MKSSFGKLFVLASGMAWLGATPAGALSWEKVTQGACADVYGGEVCTWSREQGEVLLEFGATVPMATVDNAPLGGEMVFPPVAQARIALPETVREQTGFDHLGINWEAHGHPPGPFLTPHFDFHFYTISADSADAIDCSDSGKPGVLPAGYQLPDLEIPDMGTLVGLCVPQMGMHAVRDDELMSTETFSASMILGYYGQELVFVEPMVTRARLMQGRNFALVVPGVPASSGMNAWPVGLEARFDDERRSWEFVFTMRAAP
jgi:hypothetical protein